MIGFAVSSFWLYGLFVVPRKTRRRLAAFVDVAQQPEAPRTRSRSPSLSMSAKANVGTLTPSMPRFVFGAIVVVLFAVLGMSTSVLLQLAPLHVPPVEWLNTGMWPGHPVPFHCADWRQSLSHTSMPA